MWGDCCSPHLVWKVVSFFPVILYTTRVSELLLQTKFFRPALRPSTITRQHLIDRLNGALGEGAPGFVARLTLVSAPAGFGKTTLVSAWLAQLAPRVATAWLSLEDDDNDPVRFLVYLLAALQTAVVGLGQAAFVSLQSPQPPTAETILTLLINEIGTADRPIVLVLDDYHVITTPAIHKALAFLLEHLPPSLHLLLTTRSDPPLPLPRLRARSELVEIRADELRFSAGEAQRFFAQVLGLALSGAEAAALEQRTEGWVAGLQLTALALHGRVSQTGRDDLHAFITAFTGSHRYILDYLADEVLARRPAGTKDFLLQTSVLDRMCGPLCEVVTGQPDGQATLERLEQANLFLVPLDEARQWYRYHHLFAELLRQRLRQTPGADPAELHRRAREWYRQHGLLPEAVNHALAGGDFEAAADLVEQLAGTLLRSGAGSSLSTWLDALPEALLHARPRLCLARAWTYIMGASIDPQNAIEWVQRAQQAAPSGLAADGELAGEAAALRAMVAAIWEDTVLSIKLSRQALDTLPEDSPWRSVMAFSLGSTLFLAGDMAGAPRALRQAQRLSQQDGARYIELNAASFLADIAVLQGRLNQAMDMYRQVLAKADPGIPQKGALMARAGLASILYERNQLQAAQAEIEQGITQVEQVGGSWSALVLYRALARIQQASGQWAEALASLNRAFESGQRTQVRIVVTQAAALRARLLLAQGNLQAATAWVADSGLHPDDPESDHPGLQEEAYLCLARVLDATGRPTEAMALLDRLLRAAEGEGRSGSVIAVQILRSLILQTAGDLAGALDCLERALTLAERQGYCRVFLDEGAPMVALLDKARQHALFPEYVERLLMIYRAEVARMSSANLLPEALSERELEVLRLVATGASNQQIAAELVIALSTVKKHVGNIFVKLDTPNRVQAVARARELGLL